MTTTTTDDLKRAKSKRRKANDAHIFETFVTAHEWVHSPARDHYPVGRSVLARCQCGAESWGVTTERHGKIDAVESLPLGVDLKRCAYTGRRNG